MYNVQPSRRRPTDSEAPTLENHVGGEERDEEGKVGSETQLDRPPSARGSRKGMAQHLDEGETGTAG